MQPDQWKKESRRHETKGDQTLHSQRESHSHFSDRGEARRQGNQLGEQAAAQPKGEQRQNPAEGTLQPQKRQCQKKQQVIRAEQRVAQTADQTLDGSQRRRLDTLERMVCQCWRGPRQNKEQGGRHRPDAVCTPSKSVDSQKSILVDG